MRTYLLLAEAEDVAHGMRTAIEYFDPRRRGTDLPVIVMPRSGARSASSLFHELAGRIEPHLVWEPEVERRLTVVVDSADLRRVNPLEPGASFHAALGMLILAFPEVHWVFANALIGTSATTSRDPHDRSLDTWRELLRWHTLTALARPDLEPLFDPSGLRDLVKDNARRTRDDDATLLAPFLPSRPELATAFDDELSYAFFNAYAAYRFGHRALPVSSMDLARELWASAERNPGDFVLSMEDVYAKLPDAENYEHLARLEEGVPQGRHSQLPGLYVLGRTCSGTGRVVVSSHHDPRVPGLERQNREFCDRNGIKRVQKPFKGMFAFWRDLGAVRGAQRGPRRITATYYRTGFVWPPHDSANDTETTGHSPPGRLNLIGSALLTRARRVWLAGVGSTADATRGAVLATVALELYGCRVPTSSVDALLLRHQFEVAAECRFSGVEYNIDVRTRLRELREELRAVFARSPESHRNVNNAEMLIVNSLVLLLVAHAQFDEEQRLRTELLSLHHSLIDGLRSWWTARFHDLHALVWRFDRSMAPLPSLLKILWHIVFLIVLAPVAGLVWLKDKYVEFVTGSPAKLVTGAAGWVLGLGALLVAGERGFEAPRAVVGGVLRQAARAADQILGGPQGTAHELAVALVRSFELQTGINLAASGMETWKLVVCAIGTIMGLVHFGLLVSMMYTRFTRK